MQTELIRPRNTQPYLPDGSVDQQASAIRSARAGMDQSCLTVLLLTRSAAHAEAAVLHAIESMDAEGYSSDTLLLESVRAALATARDPGAGAREIESAAELLPIELRRVLRLPLDLRSCYVLRLLAGLSREQCAGLLETSVEHVDEHVCSAATRLASTAASSLRIYTHDSSAAFRFQLVGDLCAAGALSLEQARRTAESTIGGRPLIVDLSAMTGVDSAGRDLLHHWHSEGARIVVVPAESRPRIAHLTGLPVTQLAVNARVPLWKRLRIGREPRSAARSAVALSAHTSA